MKHQIPIISIEKYLKDLHACPDLELENKFFFAPGGWPVLIKDDIDKITRLFIRSQDFTYAGKLVEEGYHIAYYPKFREAIHIQIIPHIPEQSPTGGFLFGSMEGIPEGALREHSFYQKNNYNLTLSFHQRSHELHEHEDQYRMHADAVHALAKSLMHEDIPFCIPYKPIVYWPEIKEYLGQEVP